MRTAIGLLFLILTSFPVISSSRNSLGRQQLHQAAQQRAEPIVSKVQVLRKKSWDLVSTLKKEDFLLLEDGERQQIMHFGLEDLPLSILLLQDLSGSMKPIKNDVLDNILPALNQLKTHDELALMVFAEKARLVQGLTSDRQLIANAIAQQKETLAELKTETNIHDALYEAAAYLCKTASDKKRRIIIAITDNVITKDAGHSRNALLRDLSQADVAVCGLIVPTEGTFASGLVHMERGVEAYAEETGGIAWVTKQKEVGAALARMINSYRNSYVIGYTSSNSKQDGKFRRIRLKVSPDVERREGGLIILSRQGCYARSDNTTSKQTDKPRL